MDHLAALAKIERMGAQLDRLRDSHDRLLAAAKDACGHLVSHNDAYYTLDVEPYYGLIKAIVNAEDLTQLPLT
jgi:hypothetical protein